MKKPYLVYALAVCFILAPIGNILLSLSVSGVGDWMQPDRFSYYMSLIPASDWFWFGLVFLSGFALFRPHKLTWSFAMLTLLIVLMIHVYKAVYVRHATSIYQDVHFYSALLSTLAVAALGYHFRFPYLDRRSNWWTDVQRFEASLPVSFTFATKIQGTMRDISATGAFVEMASIDLKQFNSALRCRMKVEEPLNLTLDVQVTQVRPNGVGVRIIAFSTGRPEAWRTYIAKLRSPQGKS